MMARSSALRCERSSSGGSAMAARVPPVPQALQGTTAPTGRSTIASFSLDGASVWTLRRGASSRRRQLVLRRPSKRESLPLPARRSSVSESTDDSRRAFREHVKRAPCSNRHTTTRTSRGSPETSSHKSVWRQKHSRPPKRDGQRKPILRVPRFANCRREDEEEGKADDQRWRN